MAHKQKTQTIFFWLDTSLLPWWKKAMYPPKWHSYKNDQKISFDP